MKPSRFRYPSLYYVCANTNALMSKMGQWNSFTWDWSYHGGWDYEIEGKNKERELFNLRTMFIWIIMAFLVKSCSAFLKKILFLENKPFLFGICSSPAPPKVEFNLRLAYYKGMIWVLSIKNRLRLQSICSFIMEWYGSYDHRW